MEDNICKKYEAIYKQLIHYDLKSLHILEEIFKDKMPHLEEKERLKQALKNTYNLPEGKQC